MSRRRHRNLDRGIKQALHSVDVPFRRERHGKPVVIRKRHIKTVNEKIVVTYTLEPVTPETKRTMRVAEGPTGTHGKLNVRASIGKKKPQEAKP